MSVIHFFSYKWIIIIFFFIINKDMHQFFMPFYNLTGNQVRERNKK